jgi:hypothetical protein
MHYHERLLPSSRCGPISPDEGAPPCFFACRILDLDFREDLSLLKEAASG